MGRYRGNHCEIRPKTRLRGGCIPEKRCSPRWWRHPKDENVSLRAKRSNLFDRDCFVACAPRNDTPSSLMRCHCCSFDRLPLFWNALVSSRQYQTHFVSSQKEGARAVDFHFAVPSFYHGLLPVCENFSGSSRITVGHLRPFDPTEVGRRQ